MKNKIIVLIVICILLAFFLPASILGTINYINNSPANNPNHETKHNGFLWFYDNDTLLSKYECVAKDCDIASTTVDDEEYDINYYKDGNYKFSTFDNMFTFIYDEEKIKLYSIQSDNVLQEYLKIKNYNAKTENNVIIIKNFSNKWGALTIGSSLSAVLPFEYDFIGLKNDMDGETLKASEFIVLKENKWNLIKDGEQILKDGLDYPIIDYYNNIIITKHKENEDNIIKLYNLEGNIAFGNLNISDYKSVDKFIALFTDKMLVIFDDEKNIVLKTINNDLISGDITFNYENNIFEILLNGDVIEKIELNS